MNGLNIGIMNLFKRLFNKSAKEPKTEHTNQESEVHTDEINFTEVFSEESVTDRYTEDAIDPEMLDGCLKMVEGYFIANKITDYNKKALNHPKNLDRTIDDGFGFALYCKASNMGDREAALFLAISLSDYLMKAYGFKMYKDSKPEHPLRGMTLKYNKDGIVLSLYPMEYAVKTLNYDGGFEELLSKVNANIGTMAKVKNKFEEFLNDDDDELN